MTTRDELREILDSLTDAIENMDHAYPDPRTPREVKRERASKLQDNLLVLLEAGAALRDVAVNSGKGMLSVERYDAALKAAREGK